MRAPGQRADAFGASTAYGGRGVPSNYRIRRFAIRKRGALISVELGLSVLRLNRAAARNRGCAGWVTTATGSNDDVVAFRCDTDQRTESYR